MEPPKCWMYNHYRTSRFFHIIYPYEPIDHVFNFGKEFISVDGQISLTLRKGGRHGDEFFIETNRKPPKRNKRIKVSEKEDGHHIIVNGEDKGKEYIDEEENSKDNPVTYKIQKVNGNSLGKIFNERYFPIKSVDWLIKSLKVLKKISEMNEEELKGFDHYSFEKLVEEEWSNE